MGKKINLLAQSNKGKIYKLSTPGKDEAIGGEPDQTDIGGDSMKAVSQWLTKLGELRREVDRLRAHICNKYAEDMGDNMTCATQ